MGSVEELYIAPTTPQVKEFNCNFNFLDFELIFNSKLNSHTSCIPGVQGMHDYGETTMHD